MNLSPRLIEMHNVLKMILSKKKRFDFFKIYATLFFDSINLLTLEMEREFKYSSSLVIEPDACVKRQLL